MLNRDSAMSSNRDREFFTRRVNFTHSASRRDAATGQTTTDFCPAATTSRPVLYQFALRPSHIRRIVDHLVADQSVQGGGQGPGMLVRFGIDPYDPLADRQSTVDLVDL